MPPAGGAPNVPDGRLDGRKSGLAEPAARRAARSAGPRPRADPQRALRHLDRRRRIRPSPAWPRGLYRAAAGRVAGDQLPRGEERPAGPPQPRAPPPPTPALRGPGPKRPRGGARTPPP